jgi:uncharacterized membrane protein YgaE (UPF0421/DUF939 family)
MLSRVFDPRILRPTSIRSAFVRRGRIPGLRTAKTTLAAVLAYLIAGLMHTSDQPVLASLTALLVVQLTLYSTMRHGIDRVLSVVAGVLVAYGVASLTGLTWWSLGLVVAMSIVAGRLLRLGPFLLEAPISAMLVLAAAGLGTRAGVSDAGAALAATGRVAETVIGALVGVAVNLVIAPPLYIQPAGDAVDELVSRISAFSRDLAAALREDWTRARATEFLDRARELGAEVARADRQLDRTEESARLNPRGRLAREARPRLRVALTGLEHCYMSLRNLSRAVLDRTYFVPADDPEGAYSAAARAALADVLEAFADSIETVPAQPAEGERAEFSELLARRDELATFLLVDPWADPAAWEQHGALLAAVDRLRVEVMAATRPGVEPWQPEPVGGRSRVAVREAVERMSRRRSERVSRAGTPR